MALQIRRGLNSQREQISSTNPVLVGEFLYVTDQKKLYIGTGDPGEEKGILIAGYTTGDIELISSNMLTAGTHSNISFTYDSLSHTLNAKLDLSLYDGEIVASAINGTLIADDSTVLVDAVAGRFNLNGTIETSVVPTFNSVSDLGEDTHRFNNLYLGGNSIFMQSAKIEAFGTYLNLPLNSTINGERIATIGSDFTGSIFADDSTLLVDGISGQIVGDINAKLGGNLDLNNFNIVGSGNVNATTLITDNVLSSGTVLFKNYNDIRITVKLESPDAISVVKLTRTASTDISTDNNISYGSIYFERDDPINNSLTTGIISGGNNFIRLINRTNGSTLEINTLTWLDGKLGVGNNVPIEKLDVTGNAKLSGFMQIGTFTDTTRNSLTPAIGMIIYNTTSNKFQGYQNTNGSTLEWVDLS